MNAREVAHALRNQIFGSGVDAVKVEHEFAAALEACGLRRAIEAIEQCAIEAGERSPEGVSSHSMLGDRWDARILALKAELEKLEAT